MRITEIKITPPLGTQNGNWVLFKIITDEGIKGLGEWRAGAPVEQLRRLIVGQDSFNIN